MQKAKGKTRHISTKPSILRVIDSEDSLLHFLLRLDLVDVKRTFVHLVFLLQLLDHIVLVDFISVEVERFRLALSQVEQRDLRVSRFTECSSSKIYVDQSFKPTLRNYFEGAIVHPAESEHLALITQRRVKVKLWHFKFPVGIQDISNNKVLIFPIHIHIEVERRRKDERVFYVVH